MIPLRVKVECLSGNTQLPFLVRLGGASESPLSLRHEAPLVEETTQFSLYASEFGAFRVVDMASNEIAGDVLLIDPARSVAHRLIRARSPHNTFLVTEQCDQLCVMCSQPPKKDHVDLFWAYEDAIRLAPPDMTIGLSGGEPTLHKRSLFELVKLGLQERPDLKFHVLTNAQHFSEEDIDTLQSLQNVLWGVPIYSNDSAIHDTVVEKPGAFETLCNSLAILGRSGAAIELRTVVLSQNISALPRLARFISKNIPFAEFWAIMQLENIGFGRKNWNSIFCDTSRDFGSVAEAINVTRSANGKVALYNFPLCTVPANYRALAAPSISDWKRRFLDGCSGCRLQPSCGGFFQWYPEDRGFADWGNA